MELLGVEGWADHRLFAEAAKEASG